MDDNDLLFQSVWIFGNEVPAGAAHVLNSAGSFPAKHFFCFGSISIAGSDVACTTWCDLVVDAVPACFFECVENLENAGTVAGSEVDGFHAGVGQAVVNCFKVAQ